MNPKQRKLSQSYQKALSSHLTAQPTPSLAIAQALGEQAVALGLETLDMAKMHVEAESELMGSLKLGDSRETEISRATVFFAEAIIPIEKTHRGARDAATHLTNTVKALNERTLELAASVAGLKREELQRLSVEEALRASEGATSTSLAASRLVQDDLRNLAHHLLSSQEDERSRISRELNDVIAQTLTGINVRLAELKVEAKTNTQALQKKISSTQQLVERSVEAVHRFARALRPSVLDDLGLIPALKTYLQHYLRETGVRVSLKAATKVESSNNATRTTLYRVAQEALTNVARHAKASTALVSIVCTEGDLCMTIKDDGMGFIMAGLPMAKKKSRLGLLGMKERVEMVGGTFSIQSTPGHGTIVRVEIRAKSVNPQ